MAEFHKFPPEQTEKLVGHFSKVAGRMIVAPVVMVSTDEKLLILGGNTSKLIFPNQSFSVRHSIVADVSNGESITGYRLVAPPIRGHFRDPATACVNKRANYLGMFKVKDDDKNKAIVPVVFDLDCSSSDKALRPATDYLCSNSIYTKFLWKSFDEAESLAKSACDARPSSEAPRLSEGAGQILAHFLDVHTELVS